MGRTTARAAGSTTSIRKYMDGKIDASEYFREVRENTARRVSRELKTPKKEARGTA